PIASTDGPTNRPGPTLERTPPGIPASMANVGPGEPATSPVADSNPPTECAASRDPAACKTAADAIAACAAVLEVFGNRDCIELAMREGVKTAAERFGKP